MSIAAVIFDHDGVIVNSEPWYREAALRQFAELGVSLAPSELDQFTGMAADRMWITLRERFQLAQPVPDLIRREQDLFLEVFAAQPAPVPIPGVRELIDGLRADGCRLAVASSSCRRIVEGVLQRISLRDRFELLVCGDEIVNGKPAPDIFLAAARGLGASADQCAVIEDSGNGVRAAKAAGMFCIGVRNPDSGNQDLSPAEMVIADYGTDSRTELRGRLRGLGPSA